MSQLGLAQPLWLRDRRHPIRVPRFTGKLTVEIAVIGGGLTGVSVAWLFARAGVSVALLEASRIGRGSSGASTALLMQEPDRDFVELADLYGAQRARRIWELSAKATRNMIDTLHRLKIPCGLAERDSIYYTTKGDEGRLLQRELRRRTANGLPGRWLDAPALRQATGIAGDGGGIRTPGNAQTDPYRACLGLARAARCEGARLFERSPVARIDIGAGGVTIVTGGGAVQAKQVIVATGYATPDFRPLLTQFRLMTTYVVATRPMTAPERRALGLGPVMLWDTARPYHYARWTPDHRLLFGGADRQLDSRHRRRQAYRAGLAALRRHFANLWPALDEIDVDAAWEGLFATTPDGLPFVGPHRQYPRHLFALGYGGNGMTFGFLAAQLLLDRCQGKEKSAADLELFGFDRRGAIHAKPRRRSEREQRRRHQARHSDQSRERN
jgi:glycine/D-amino acid oxidase-like deaminating enzyme